MRIACPSPERPLDGRTLSPGSLPWISSVRPAAGALSSWDVLMDAIVLPSFLRCTPSVPVPVTTISLSWMALCSRANSTRATCPVVTFTCCVVVP